MKNCVLSIHVLCTQTFQVVGKTGDANMVMFVGHADHPNFTGDILPLGCDTQYRTGDAVTLSARYMLVGKDAAGNDCHLFIENNGSMQLPPESPVVSTVPTIRTDSPLLSWLETAELTGTVSPEGENRVFIEIFAEEAGK